MNVIVGEGLDGCGKSTTLKALADAYDGAYLHFPSCDSVETWIKAIRTYSDKPYVFVDRLHWSEVTYGELVRGQTALTDFDVWVLEGWLIAKQAHIIYIDAVTSYTLKRIEDRYHGVVEGSQLRQRMFEAYAESNVSKSRVIPVNGIVDDFREIQASVFEEIKTVSQAYDFGDQGMGSHTPWVWLVGDQHNVSKGKHITDVTFGDNCGRYLHRALKILRWPWPTYHISNAYDDDEGNMRDLYHKWCKLGKPKIVALGKRASAALDYWEMVYNSVEHPQYMRRFHSDKILEYAKSIKEASR
jgi:thymidylate kinase